MQEDPQTYTDRTSVYATACRCTKPFPVPHIQSRINKETKWHPLSLMHLFWQKKKKPKTYWLPSLKWPVHITFQPLHYLFVIIYRICQQAARLYHWLTYFCAAFDSKENHLFQNNTQVLHKRLIMKHSRHPRGNRGTRFLMQNNSSSACGFCRRI